MENHEIDLTESNLWRSPLQNLDSFLQGKILHSLAEIN